MLDRWRPLASPCVDSDIIYDIPTVRNDSQYIAGFRLAEENDKNPDDSWTFRRIAVLQ